MIPYLRNNEYSLLRCIVKPIAFIFLYFFLALVFFYQGSLLNYPLGVGDVVLYVLPNLLTLNSFWNPYILSGTSSLCNILNQTFYPLNKIFFSVFKDIFAYNLYMLTHYALAGYFTYIFLKSLRLKGLAAFLGSLIFMFSGFMIGHKNQGAVMNTAIWLPFVLYCIEKYKQEGKIFFIILGSFGFSFSIFAGYPQITLYLTIVAFLYILFRGLSEKIDLRFITGSILMLAMGLLLSSIQLLPLLELIRFTARENISYDFFVLYSFDLKSLPLLIFPFFYGTHAPGFYSKIYDGPWNLSELAGYMGILPLCLAAMCLIMMWRNKQVLFWTLIAIAGFILLLGDTTPVYRFLYHVPIYNMFRAPSRNWLEVNFAVAVLASFCVSYLLEKHKIGRAAIMFSALMVSIILVVITSKILLSIDFSAVNASSLMTGTNSYSTLIKNFQSKSAIVYIPLCIICTAVLSLWLLPRFYSSRNYWLIVGVIIFFDLYSFGHFHENNYPDKNEVYAEKNDVFRFLKNEECTMGNFRIWPVEMDTELLYPCTNMFYGVSTINGVSPVWLKDYVGLTGFVPPNGAIDRASILLKNNYIISGLAGKYVVTTSEEIAKILESVRTVRNQQKGSEVRALSIISKEDVSKWELSNAIFEERRFILKCPNENSISSIQSPITIKEKNQSYKITFKVKGNLKDVLVVQIYAKDYAPLGNWVWIENKDIDYDKKFTEIIRTLDSGDCPEDGYVRLFTHSRSPIEVKDIVLEEIPHNRILWGKEGNNKFYKKVYETGHGIKIYENLNYLPRVRFVKSSVPVSNFMEAANLLKYDTGLNLKERGLVEGLPKSYFGAGEILEVKFRKGRINIKARTTGRAFLVLADTYFPGWKAYIDGKETRIYKTNGVTRGILIDGEGKHDIVFEYNPRSFKIGFLISISVATVLFLVFLEKKEIFKKFDRR